MKYIRYYFALAILSLVFVPACAPAPPADPEAAYRKAVEDAATADPSEISYTLTPIVDWNRDLIWDGQGENERVLMVTWTSWSGYNGQEGQTMDLARETWVTPAPDIKDFCQANWLAPPDLVPRLEELLGLPPDNGKTTFVEVWVRPADLFRPTPDPEITDREAELDFPKVDGSLSVTDAYIQWFNTLMDSSYGENGYPWTRLGYTYDWGNPAGEVGLSEFVIRMGATVEVHSVSTTEDYCRWW